MRYSFIYFTCIKYLIYTRNHMKQGVKVSRSFVIGNVILDIKDFSIGNWLYNYYEPLYQNTKKRILFLCTEILHEIYKNKIVESCESLDFHWAKNNQVIKWRSAWE